MTLYYYSTPTNNLLLVASLLALIAACNILHPFQPQPSTDLERDLRQEYSSVYARKYLGRLHDLGILFDGLFED